jgi:hypothetical protein
MKRNFDFGKHFFLFYNNLLTASRSKKEAKFLKKFISSYNSKILDFGFGWARHLKAFAELDYRDLTGIDSSKKLLEKAKKNLTKYPFVKLAKSSFTEFMPNKKYDFIFQVFQTFGYDTKLHDQKNLNNVKELLSDKGTYLLDLRNPLKLLKSETFDVPSSIKIQPYQAKRRFRYLYDLNGIKDFGEWNIYTLEELQIMFTNAGLKIIKTFGDFNGNRYSEDSERLIIVAKKDN